MGLKVPQNMVAIKLVVLHKTNKVLYVVQQQATKHVQDTIVRQKEHVKRRIYLEYVPSGNILTTNMDMVGSLLQHTIARKQQLQVVVVVQQQPIRLATYTNALAQELQIIVHGAVGVVGPRIHVLQQQQENVMKEQSIIKRQGLGMIGPILSIQQHLYQRRLITDLEP